MAKEKDLGVIRVVRREDPFVQVHQATAQDKRLSFKARGLLVYILSLPPNWEVRVAHLVREGKEGREAIRGAFDELEEFGYCERKKVRRDDGTFAWTTAVYEHPGLNDAYLLRLEATSDGNPSMDQGRQTVDGEPAVESRLPNKRPERPDDSRQPAAEAAEGVEAADEAESPRATAQRLCEEFWESQTPRPVLQGGFIALVKIAERFVEAGFTEQQVGWALRHTRAYTIDSITFTIRTAIEERARAEGAGRHLTANLEALDMIRGVHREVGQ